MSYYVRLSNLAPLYAGHSGFTTIVDQDDNGFLTAGDAVVHCADGVCGQPDRYEARAEDLNNLGSLEAFLEKSSARRVSFVYDDLGIPAYLAFSQVRGARLEGFVDWQLGKLYAPGQLERSFAEVDSEISRLLQAKEEELHICSTLRARRTRASCDLAVETHYARLLLSADRYALRFEDFQLAYQPLDESFQQGTLTFAGVRNYLLLYYDVKKADREHDLAKLGGQH